VSGDHDFGHAALHDGASHLTHGIANLPLEGIRHVENTTIEMYLALKISIHEAYSCCLTLMELRNTSSSLGYTAPAHNMYHMLNMGEDNNDDITVATVAAASSSSGNDGKLIGLRHGC
jgi:hypothetical protein